MLEKALSALKSRKKNKQPFVEAWKARPIGYPRLAERIAYKPETGIYRRFDALNARRILYLQAQLCIIETDLRELEVDDNNGKGGKRSQYATDFQCMLEEPVDTDRPQLELIEKMDKKLNQYSKRPQTTLHRFTTRLLTASRRPDKALLQISMLHRLNAPDRFDLSDIQLFLQSEDMGPDAMDGGDSDTWGNPEDPNNHAPDLIGVHPRLKEDTFSRIISERAIYLFKYGLGLFTRGHRDLGRKVYYDTTVLKITLWISSAVAAVLPIASMLVLITLKSLKAKLWTIAAFNVLMSFGLTFLANAKRAEVFAVTSAYVYQAHTRQFTDVSRFAAVLVVFVSTDRSEPAN
jgi:hypothetical protein